MTGNAMGLVDQAGSIGNGERGTLAGPNGISANMVDAGITSDDDSFDALPGIMLDQVMFLSKRGDMDRCQDERHAMVLTNG